MNAEWSSVSLGELFKVKHGFAFKGEYFVDEPTDFLLVTPGNFAIGGGFQNPKPKYYSGPIPKEYVLDPLKIVVTMTDLSKQSDTLGLPAVIPDDGLTWLHNQRVGLLEFKENFKTHPRFVSYLLRDHAYRSWIIGSATGTTVKHTSPNRIESFECLVPTYEEQKAIASILGSLDDKIELNRQMNETLEAMAQALFKSWFVDFDPVIDNALAAGNEIPEPLQKRAAARQALGDQRKPLPADIQAFFPNRFIFTDEIGWVPEGWRIGKFADIASHVRENVKAEDVSDFEIYVGLEHIGRKQIFLSESAKGESVDSNKSKFEANDLLFGKLRPYFHKICIAPEEGICSTDILVFRAKQITYQSLMFMTAFQDEFVEYANLRSTGTRMPRASAKDMLEFLIILPDEEVVNNFENRISDFWSRGLRNIEETGTLAQLRDALLPKLLSGELCIPDAERLVAEAV